MSTQLQLVLVSAGTSDPSSTRLLADRVSQRVAQAFVRRAIAIVAVDVAKPRRELRERIGVDAAVLLQTVARGLSADRRSNPTSQRR